MLNRCNVFFRSFDPIFQFFRFQPTKRAPHWKRAMATPAGVLTCQILSNGRIIHHVVVVTFGAYLNAGTMAGWIIRLLVHFLRPC